MDDSTQQKMRGFAGSDNLLARASNSITGSVGSSSTVLLDY